jgi:hypothetical protein
MNIEGQMRVTNRRRWTHWQWIRLEQTVIILMAIIGLAVVAFFAIKSSLLNAGAAGYPPRISFQQSAR